MRFLVDECTGPAAARWLKSQGHDVFSVYDEARGLDDTAIIELAWRENRILITNDKDFGEKIARSGQPHCGVIFLRLKDERAYNKIAVLTHFLNGYAERLLTPQMIVVTENKVRFGK